MAVLDRVALAREGHEGAAESLGWVPEHDDTAPAWAALELLPVTGLDALSTVVPPDPATLRPGPAAADLHPDVLAELPGDTAARSTAPQHP
ncbi:hypothetical protein FE374_10055 [Georgenia yuyongxinii]|uniref:Uncharacterized protein n=1 Tax=Georgenia yuyongxinii TaxID=2589797 RepID=A0A5B8CA17_9MICO|nr:hypothetical protein [Georgenia yuyongxinii]QDC24906.1 hypothetical protein FE374_10055 [Georgenia yuyongxinii]